jgi:hypothetical protein
LVALYQPGATAMRVASAPSVDFDGQVTLIWNDAQSVADGVWLADVGGRGVTRGITLRPAFPAGGDSGARALLRQSDVTGPAELAAEDPDAQDETRGGTQDLTLLRSLRQFGGITPQTAAATGTARRVVRLEGLGLAGEPQPALIQVAALRAPGGGWVAAVSVGPDHPLSNDELLRNGGVVGPGSGELTNSHAGVIALPAPRGGGTPLAGFKVPTPDDQADSYVVAWAPPHIVAVRSGDVSAPVVDGIALLDARNGGERVHRGKPDQALLLEGLDATGAVVARTRVNEPHIDAPARGETGETEGIPTRLPWPTVRWP